VDVGDKSGRNQLLRVGNEHERSLHHLSMLRSPLQGVKAASGALGIFMAPGASPGGAQTAKQLSKPSSNPVRRAALGYSS
jgi:hypothetical protein